MTTGKKENQWSKDVERVSKRKRRVVMKCLSMVTVHLESQYELYSIKSFQ